MEEIIFLGNTVSRQYTNNEFIKFGGVLSRPMKRIQNFMNFIFYFKKGDKNGKYWKNAKII